MNNKTRKFTYSKVDGTQELFVCLACKIRKTGERRLKSPFGWYLVCESCGENCYEIDVPLIETMILLNNKGYKTLQSCTGHLWKQSFEDGSYILKSGGTYIMFSKDVKLGSLPQGFYLDDKDNSLRALDFLPKIEEPKKLREQIDQWVFALNQWAKLLTPIA